MALRFRNLLSALLLLALAGCDWGATTPVSIEMEFVPSHRLNENGSCTVSFVARAYGFGSAQWTRVVVRRSTSVLASYEGAQTAQFWGSQTIAAGQTQASAPFDAPSAAADVLIDVSYRIGGPERTIQLRPNCGTA